jgi:putative membrane protein
MVRKLVSQIIAGVLGLALAIWFIPGVKILILPDSNFFGISLTTNWHIIILLGVVFGIINTFLRPILNTITLPLRIVTLGLFSFVINMAIIWGVDLIFQEITNDWFFPLLWTTLIIWGLDIIIPALLKKKENY